MEQWNMNTALAAMCYVYYTQHAVRCRAVHVLTARQVGHGASAAQLSGCTPQKNMRNVQGDRSSSDVCT